MPKDETADSLRDLESLTAQIKITGEEKEMLAEVVEYVTDVLGFSPKKTEMYSKIFAVGLRQYYEKIQSVSKP